MLKIIESYAMVLNFKDGSSEIIKCKDFEAGEGKVCLYEASVEGDEVDFIVVMEDTLQSYVGIANKKDG